MIPYEELSAALERWRVKNGLPGTPPLFAEGSTMRRPAAAAAPPPPPAYSAPAFDSAPAYDSGPAAYDSGGAAYDSGPAAYDSGAAYAAPPPAPAAARVPPPPQTPETLDESVDEFAEDDVLDEAALDNEGPDFAMAFGSAPEPPPPPPSSSASFASDDDDRESTVIGSPTPGLSPEEEDEFNAAEKTPV